MKGWKELIMAATWLCCLGLVTTADAGSLKKEPTFDKSPGPAFRTVDGTLKKINGQYYVVEEYTGNKVRLFVNKKTRMMRGKKKPGDSIRAEVTKGYFANSIQ